MLLGVIATVILYAILGPGKRPVLLNYVPRGVDFDPPNPANVEGSYRSGWRSRRATRLRERALLRVDDFELRRLRCDELR